MNLKKCMIVLTSLLIANLAVAQNSGNNKRLNIHTNPITWLLGVYSLGADLAVTRNLTLGGSYNIIDLSDQEFDDNIDADAKGFSLRAQYFMSEVFNDGWYFTGFGDFVKGDVKDTNTAEFADLKVNSLGLTVGYFWRWDNFNIQLGLGAQSTKIEVTNSTLSAQDRSDIEDLEGINPTGDFRIGLAF